MHENAEIIIITKSSQKQGKKAEGIYLTVTLHISEKNMKKRLCLNLYVPPITFKSIGSTQNAQKSRN
jgi:hypothetical protein